MKRLLPKQNQNPVFGISSRCITLGLTALLSNGLAVEALSQDLQSAPSAESSLTEINGLVVDESITKVGRDFYEVFYAKWQAPPAEMSYTIFIKELPQIGQGSLVSVYLDDTELFSQPLQPRYEVVEAVAEYAVALVSNYVTNYQQMSQQLGNEDQQGSGIF